MARVQPRGSFPAGPRPRPHGVGLAAWRAAAAFGSLPVSLSQTAGADARAALCVGGPGGTAGVLARVSSRRDGAEQLSVSQS